MTRIVFLLLCMILIILLIMLNVLYSKYASLIESTKKNNYYYSLLKLWVSKRNSGKRLGEYLRQHGIDRVAVYGNGDLGRLLCEELEQDSIVIEYVLDRNKTKSDYPVYALGEKIPQPKAVIITPYLEYDQIIERLRKDVECEMISLEDIIYDY